MSKANQVVDWSSDVRDKVREASHTILCCWSDWESSAGHDEQVSQSCDAQEFAALKAENERLRGWLVQLVAGYEARVMKKVMHCTCRYCVAWREANAALNATDGCREQAARLLVEMGDV